MKYSAQIKPVSYLDSSADQLLRSFDGHAGPIIIADNGEAKMVLMDIHTYEAQLESIAFLKLVQMGTKEIADGKFQEAASFFSDMDEDD